MQKTHYPLDFSPNALRYDFLSIGKNAVSKSIIYTPTEIPDFYSLALVDIYEDGTADDTSISDNGDMEKILITVFHTFSIFFNNYPNAIVGFEGSTLSRTRLYRIAISHELASINEVYKVWGIIIDTIEPFKKDRPYSGFLISRKNINIA